MPATCGISSCITCNSYDVRRLRFEEFEWKAIMDWSREYWGAVNDKVKEVADSLAPHLEGYIGDEKDTEYVKASEFHDRMLKHVVEKTLPDAGNARMEPMDMTKVPKDHVDETLKACGIPEQFRQDREFKLATVEAVAHPEKGMERKVVKCMLCGKYVEKGECPKNMAGDTWPFCEECYARELENLNWAKMEKERMGVLPSQAMSELPPTPLATTTHGYCVKCQSLTGLPPTDLLERGWQLSPDHVLPGMVCPWCRKQEAPKCFQCGVGHGGGGFDLIRLGNEEYLCPACVRGGKKDGPRS